MAATHTNRAKHPCVRYTLLAGSFARSGAAGTNRLAFSGRLARHRLAPGRYRLRAVATDAAGRHSALRRVRFRVTRR